MDKLINNIQDNFYNNHPQGIDLLKIDLEEIVRQQEDYILDLEIKLQETNNSAWEFFEQEIADLQEQLEKERNL